MNELCDCDIYTRWICYKCVTEERQFTLDYYKNFTGSEWDDGEGGPRETKIMGDHQQNISVRTYYPRPIQEPEYGFALITANQ